jgi:uncharacterized protein YceK
MKSILLIVVALLTGCASLMQPSSNLSAEQITAATKDKSATVTCSTIIGAWGTAKLVTISLDQNAIKDGGVTVDGEKGCTANITSMAPPRAPPATPPK